LTFLFICGKIRYQNNRRDKMRLKRRKRNKLTNIRIGLENLEAIDIPVTSIKYLQYSHKCGTIYNMDLRVSKDIKLLTFVEDCENKGVDRLLAYNDICWIRMYYEDSSYKVRYVKWHDEEEDYNRYQSSYMDGEELVIKINSVAGNE